MAINERLIHTAAADAAAGDAGEEGLILHLDANDIDSYDGDGDVWYDIANHEYTPTTDVSEHFNTVIWTGDGSTDRDITGVGFQPDLVWIKKRTNDTKDHRLFDSLRGAGNVIYPNQNYAEASPTNELNGFIIDGFNLGNASAVNDSSSADTYVAWCFKAGGAAVLNEEGDINSNVSVNNDLGFSIVSYTGNSSYGQTVGHGMDVPPELIIYKNLDNARNWRTYVKAIGANNYLNLDESAGKADYGSFNDTHPTATVFSTTDSSSADRATNYDGDDYIAYCFASKRGISKVGGYIGGSTSEIYTGFEPAWVMVKRTNASGDDWHIFDSVRGGGSKFDEFLKANTSGVESSASNREITFTRSGFKWTNTTSNAVNTSGNTYIYLAFAKSTNETSLIDDTDLELHLDPNSYSGSGSTWSDLANSNDATISGASYDEELGDWFSFDGVDDVITTTYDIPSSGAKTIEIWFNAASTQNDTYCGVIGGDAETLWIGGNLTSSYSNESIYWYQYPSELGLVIRDGEGEYLDDKWHHLAIVDTGSAHKMYLDGEEKSFTYSYGSSSTRLSADNVKLGRGYGADFMTGKIGQFRIYSSALTQAQVRQNFNFTKNNYPNGSNQTIDGAAYIPGTGGNPDLFRFDGVNDSISLDDRTASNSLTGSDLKGFTGDDATNYTISFYINTEDSGGNSIFGQPIIGYTNSDVYAALSLKDGKFTYSHYNTSWNHKQSTTSINDSAWHHCVFVHRSDATIDIYVDGNKEVDNVSATLSSGRYYIAGTIGKGYSNEYIDMDFGMLKLYDKALTSAEVTSEFNSTKSTYGL